MDGNCDEIASMINSRQFTRKHLMSTYSERKARLAIIWERIQEVVFVLRELT